MAERGQGRFHFKLTTNGLLLDEAFLDFTLRNDVLVAMSFDGVRESHDRHRRLTDGTGTFDRLLNLTAPLALPGIVSGAITAFAASLGEFGAIITFVSNIPGQTQTLPLAIYAALQIPGGEAEAARLCGLSILLALVFMTAGEFATRAARVWR